MILPRLLDSNFNEVARLQPSSLTVSLSLTPISTASMVLSSPQDVEPDMRQYVEIYGDDGESMGIFRIVQISTTYGTSKTISLEHAITTLEDSITGADITLEGTMQDVLSAVLSCQTVAHWQLGQVDDTKDDYSIAVSYSNCLQVLQEAARQADDCYLAFDQSSYPWTVSLLYKPATVASECRITRNIEDVSISLDDSALCTRVYSEYLADGYLDADTVSTWGVIAKTIQLEEDDTAEKNLEIAQKYLDECKNPAVSINIGAIQLSELTGEPLDAFIVGTLCRVALPDWGIAVDERIISLTYSDLVSDPRRVRLVLSSAQDNTAKTLNSIVQTTRQITRVVKEQHKHITETDTELKLHADRITAVAREIDLKADSAEVSELGQRVSNAEIDIDGINGKIELKADQSEVSDLGTRVSQAEIDIDGTNAAITLKADQSQVTELGNRVTSAEIDIDGAKGEISLKASKTEVDELGNTVSDLETTFTVSADGITGLVEGQGEMLSEIKARVDEISMKVRDAEGNTGKLIVTADKVASRMEDTTGKLKALTETTDEHFASLQGDITEIDGRVSTVEGSAIWQTKDDITAAVGTMYVDKDGKLHIRDGSGLQIDRGSASLGVYDSGNLTAGVLVQKLNDGTTTTKIKADKIELDGYVTMSEMEAEVASLQDGFALAFSTTDLHASTITLGEGLTATDGYITANTISASASMTVGGVEVATQSWAYSRTYCNANFATFTHLSTNYALKSELSDYQLASGLTTKSITYVKDVSATTATTPPFYNANGTQVNSGLTYVKGVSYKTESVDVVVYA